VHTVPKAEREAMREARLALFEDGVKSP